MNFLGGLQQFSRALMVPMMVLPAAALCLSLGYWFAHWEQASYLATGLTAVGHMILQQLPVIFALGVAIGLTSAQGTAAIAALIAYYIVHTVAAANHHSYQPTVFTGIMIGLISVYCYDRLQHVKLPEYLQFFGGARLVVLAASFSSFVMSQGIVLLTTTIQSAMDEAGLFLSDAGGVGVFIFGVLQRLAIPVGLHHLLGNLVWFQNGSFEMSSDVLVYGDLSRFFAGDETAGFFMAGFYPIMMFALPAAALAIIHEAREDLKPKVRISFLAAALTSLLTGITEPIEFAFLFVAPVLFVIHAILTGFSLWLCYILEIRHGFSFSGGAIDFVVNLHLSERGLWLLPIGFCFGLFYYCLFRYAIRRFQIPTPGRVDSSELDEWTGDLSFRAPLILQALGGRDNIIQLEACITRLRVQLHNSKSMDIAALKHLGAAGIIRLSGGHVQVVFGTFSEMIAEEIKKLMNMNNHQVLFRSPVSGRMIPLEDVPDPIFSGQLVGKGVAFFPERGEVVSPVHGEIVHIFPTKHAIGIRTAEGLEILIHIGIDTSLLEGKWFHSNIQTGDLVEPGQTLVKFDLQQVKKACKSLATPMLITNPEVVKSWNYAPYGGVKKGQNAVMSVVLKTTETDGGGSNAAG